MGKRDNFMKKRNISIIAYCLLFIASLSFFAKSSFALTSQNSLFNFSNIVLQQKLSANIKDVQVIKLLPFSTIVVNPGTFKTDTFIFVYKGNFDKIKAALPAGQSPISSYFFMFRDAGGLPATLLKPLNIQSYNNYVNTNTYFYPVNSSSQIDTENQKTWQGHILANTDLPVKDAGFIVAANINLQSNDNSLHPKLETPAAKTNTMQQNTQINSILQIAGLLLAVVLIGGFVAFLNFSKRKK